MKPITNALDRTFTIERDTKAYGDLVRDTAKLIGLSFTATFKLVERWEPGFVAALYDDCLGKWQNRGFKRPSHMWWTERKKLTTKSADLRAG